MKRKQSRRMEASHGIKIEFVPIGDVLAYANNARLHSPEQVDLVAKSMQQFGFVNPCLVDAGGVLIAGHCRILAAQKLGMTAVPIIRLGYLTADQARALRLADNALPAMSSWDAKLIQAEIGELKLAGYDIGLLGFPEAQLIGWGLSAAPAGKTDPDAVPELPKVPVSRLGDLWLLGAHVTCPKCGKDTPLERAVAAKA